MTALPCRKPAFTKTSHDNCHALKIYKRNALSIWIILELLPELSVYSSDGIYSKSNKTTIFLSTFVMRHIVTRLDDSAFDSWQGKEISISQKHLNWLWDPHSLLFNRDILPWAKQEPDHSPQSTAEVRVSRAICLLPCMPSLCAHKQICILHMWRCMYRCSMYDKIRNFQTS